MMKKLKQYKFLFEELVKRDFVIKYKRTVLGIGWSALFPLLQLLVMTMVFTQLFGRDTPHYMIYVFCGTTAYHFFSDATKGGMGAIMSNAKIISKINLPKYLFVLSKNIQALVNYAIILVIFFISVAIDGIPFTPKFFLLVYPICCEVLFNIGVSMILSVLFVFFRDIKYLYDIFTMLLMYLSAVFYTINRYSPEAQSLFLLNPVYLFILYFRTIIINSTVPSFEIHALMFFNSAFVVLIGGLMYKKNNNKFLYYL